MADEISLKSETKVFTISPSEEVPPVPPPIPLWKVALVVLAVIGGGAAVVTVASRKGGD